MIDKIPGYDGEPDSVKAGRIAGLATLLISETATVISALETHSTEVFAGGTALSLGATVLVVAGVGKCMNHSSPTE